MRCGPQAAGLVRRETYVHALLLSVYWTVFVFLSVAVLWSQPWYLVWLVALGANLPSLEIAELTTLFSYTSSWSYLVYMFFWLSYFPLMSSGQNLVLNTTAVLLIFIPALTYALHILGREERRGRRWELS
ncbi:MAG: hypothetical protein CEE40_08445 [Chloroflexi bacterium B3_Chlor]|nr:MAG: hypothetical protein CEE40_08445 [Chloroflexi bacterium B3_Chlor]